MLVIPVLLLELKVRTISRDKLSQIAVFKSIVRHTFVKKDARVSPKFLLPKFLRLKYVLRIFLS